MSRAERLEELASLWVLRREEPTWSDANQAELDEWLAQSDANKVAYWRLDSTWREADRIASLGAPQHLDSQRLGNPRRWIPLAIAACLVLAFTAMLARFPGLPLDGTQQASATQFETAVGGHKIVSLPDGSRVELNTATAIKAAVNEGSRTVWLERGEAFFDVAKRAGQKFVIYAGPRTITVLGTKFAVRRTGGEVVVAVLEGRVRVEDSAANGSDRQATVSAGDVAIARDRSTLVANSAQAVQQQLAWRTGQLQLDGVTLADAAEQFNRYNLKQLVIADAGAGQIPIAGSFAARKVDSFARLLGEAYGLDVRESAGRILLSTKRLASRGPLDQRPDLIASRTRSSRGADDGCGSGKAQCALIPVAPVAPKVQVASVPDEKALRDAQNWAVIHKLYPPRARAAGEQGLVGFTVRIDARGSPAACKITHTSGHPLLDLETCQLIMTHATFKRPIGLSPSQQRSYEGVVNWRLPNAPPAVTPAPPKAIAEAAAPEPLVCKRIPKTGSMAVFERKCMSRSDWQRASNQTRETWDQFQGLGRGNECEGPQCK